MNTREGSTSRGAGTLAAVIVLALVAVACTEDPDGAGTTTASTRGNQADDAPAAVDYEVLGLWDDGPCDPARAPLSVGFMTVFESPVISLVDHALALEASADAFNARGGANGACIDVHTCDDGANLDQALACVRELDEAGVVVTVNDQTTQAQAEVSAAMGQAGIPRVGSLVSPSDWADPNTYPLDAAGTGAVFLLPQALIEAAVTEIGVVRVDLPSASALIGLLEGIYGDRGATFPLDVSVPAGTTDYSQFIVAAEEAGVGGVMLVLGEQEKFQVARAGQQLGTDLRFGSTLGTSSHASVATLGEFAEQMVWVWPFPPATSDLPVYEVLRDDLAASAEELLQPENLQGSAMRSWIGLYALLRMIRDADMTDFSRDGLRTMLDQATDVPMLGIFGDESWTPARNHPGLFQRAGMSSWTVWRWDPDAQADGLEGNFVQVAALDFDEILCGSPIGATEPC